MLRNYLKIAFRNLFRHKVYSLINILGLAIGMVVCLLVFLFVNHELNFDSIHSKADHIYRLNEVQTFGAVSAQNVALSMPLMGETIKEDFPEVEEFTRFRGFGKGLYKTGDQELFIEKTAGVDSTFLQLFDFELLEGDRNAVLTEPFSVVLTESTARNFFGNENPIGKTLTSESDRVLKVTGLMKDVPENSHLQFDALISLTTITADTSARYMRRWGSNFLVTYFLMKPNVDIEKMEERFPDYLLKYMDEDVLDYYELYLQPFKEVHLASVDVTHDYHNYKKFDRKYVNLFIVLGLFVLAIASINFMNLSTARVMHRVKEVGVRKTVGASRMQLVGQFLGESVVLSVIALVIAVFAAEFLVDLLNSVSDRNLELNVLSKPLLLFGLLLLGLLTGLISGILPSLLLSAYKPVQAIQQQGKKLTGNKFNFRSSLVVLQFAIAIGLIVGTFIVMQQYDFMKNLDTGFDREQVLIIDMNRRVNENYETLRERFLTSPDILNVTASGQRLGNNLHQTSCRYESEEGVQSGSSSWVNVDHNYLSFYGIEMLDGREFSKEKGTDLNNTYILNETLAEELGWEDPVGKRFSMGGGDDELGNVIGLAKDFNYNSLHHKVEPLFICWKDWGFDEISVRLNADKIQSAIQHLQTEWKSVIGSRPLEYEFLDEHFAMLYQSEKQVSQVVPMLAFLAIFIACLGLFGLATISTEQRIKEIGVRKVLGASTGQLVMLLSKDFTKLVLIAFAITTPLTWYMMKQWLSSFAYQVGIQWAVFMVAGLLAFLVAWLTISFKSIQAARSNPVEALKYE